MNVAQISGDGTAADNLEAACDGNTYNVGGGAVVAASVTGAVGSVTGAVGSIAAGGIAAASFAAGAIDAAAIATGAIDADAIADNAIDAGAIAADAITAAKIAAGAIDAATFAAGAIDAAAIATGAIDADAIADNAIDAGAIAADAITAAKIAAGAIDAATLAADLNTYQAKVWLVDDDGGGEDHYTVAFYLNSQPVTAGITDPTLWVFSMEAVPADLVGTSGAPQALTQAGATGTYFHDEAVNRIVDGTAYLARVQATIAAATRTWYQPVGRDSYV